MNATAPARHDERIRKLAFEKSSLELAVRLMTRIGSASGVDDVIAALLRNLVDVLGGTNIALHYEIDGHRRYADAYGARREATPGEDEHVEAAFRSRAPAEIDNDFSDTQLTTRAFTRAYTWFYPLVAANEVVGVLRMDNLHISSAELQGHLPLVFNYAAQVLKNEVQNYGRLREAYDRVNAANTALTSEVSVRQQVEATLRSVNDSLETRVATRTQELTRANERLQRELGERLRADEALLRRNRELGALNRLLSGAADDLEPADLLTVACRELGEMLEGTSAYAWLLDPEATTLVNVAEHAPDQPPHLGRTASAGAVAFIRERLAGGAFTAAHVADDPRVQHAVAELAGEHTTSVLALPLTIDRALGGCIVVGSATPHHFTGIEVGLTSSVASQVSAALARRAAQADARRLRAAIEQTPASVVITDAAGYIVYVNPTFSATTGYTRDEAIGQHTRVLKSGAHDAAFYKALWETLLAGKAWHGRITNRKKSGELFTEDAVMVAVRDERGRVVNFIAVKRDITRELAQEERLRHAQRMDGIGQLAGGIAHDFNNILGAMILQIEVAQGEAALSPDTRAGLTEIRKAADRAAAMTRQLLSFSRRQAMNVGTHDLNTVVRHLLSLLSRLLGERVEVAFAPSVSPLVFDGDAAMIEQVLVNLCVNARDAMPNGGHLTIATERVVRAPSGDAVEGSDATPRPYACLRVTDTGCGMSAEVRAHLFEPFFTTKDVGKGTGLGLATSHGIVSQHHGWIDVDSVEGQGSTFTVYVPVSDRAIEARGPEAAPAPDRGHASILLVEDEPSIRRITQRCLTKLGYRVLEAVDGPAALERWDGAHGDIDLLLTDVVMPHGVSGLELSRELRHRRPSLKVILMSGYPADLVREGTTMEPGVAYLPKPFSLANLGQVVSDVLAS